MLTNEAQTGPARRTRVLLVDDHALVRSGLKLILSNHRDMEVVGEAASGEEGLEAAFRLRPDVIVMDIAMGGMTGVEATRRLAQEIPESRILIVSMHKDPVYIRNTLRAGARGYVLKDAIDTEFVTAIRAVARGDGSLSSAVSGTVLSDYRTLTRQPVDLLTNRERQVMQLLAEGGTAKDVAATLNISPYTVDAHRSRILRKLQLRGGGDLIRFAMENGMIGNRTASGGG